jgi:GH3 auxin-responsive promoter
VSSGACPWLHALPPLARKGWRTAPDPSRAAELRRVGSSDWPHWWPRLQVVSCWGEQAAESGWRQLRRQLPHVMVQAKGLVATEAVVTIPWGTQKPLAVTSHFFEFLDEGGDLSGAHALTRGKRYEVVVTNGGGLWRYRLGDVVECTGYVRATPSLRFLGRAGCVSDLRGEKLSDVFVAEALRSLWPAGPPPAYAALRASESDGGAHYELLLSDEVLTAPGGDLSARMEAALRQNPHYALARRLGQLLPLRVVPVAPDRAREELAVHRGQLGDAKPRALLRVCDAMQGSECP